MNYMDRGDLSKIIFKPKYKYEMYTVIIWMEQLFTVLLHFEKLGIKHCDLKSANILVDAAYYLIIADVGLAKSVEKSVEKSENCNPFPFAHDIESLGKVCWEIVERREFRRGSMTCDYLWTQQIISKCIEPDEEERWNAERALESIKKQKEVWERLVSYNFAPIENPDENTIVTPAVFEIKREREKWRLEVEAPLKSIHAAQNELNQMESPEPPNNVENPKPPSISQLIQDWIGYGSLEKKRFAFPENILQEYDEYQSLKETFPECEEISSKKDSPEYQEMVQSFRAQFPPLQLFKSDSGTEFLLCNRRCENEPNEYVFVHKKDFFKKLILKGEWTDDGKCFTVTTKEFQYTWGIKKMYLQTDVEQKLTFFDVNHEIDGKVKILKEKIKKYCAEQEGQDLPVKGYIFQLRCPPKISCEHGYCPFFTEIFFMRGRRIEIPVPCCVPDGARTSYRDYVLLFFEFSCLLIRMQQLCDPFDLLLVLTRAITLKSRLKNLSCPKYFLFGQVPSDQEQSENAYWLDCLELFTRKTEDLAKVIVVNKELDLGFFEFKLNEFEKIPLARVRIDLEQFLDDESFLQKISRKLLATYDCGCHRNFGTPYITPLNLSTLLRIYTGKYISVKSDLSSVTIDFPQKVLDIGMELYKHTMAHFSKHDNVSCEVWIKDSQENRNSFEAKLIADNFNDLVFE